MNKHLQKQKRIVRDFIQKQYSDTNLVQVLDHARSGKLAYRSCCCFIGAVTATHELNGAMSDYDIGHNSHLTEARRLPGGGYAEFSYSVIAVDDKGRRAILIPMLLAEIKRRKRHASMATDRIVELEPSSVL